MGNVEIEEIERTPEGLTDEPSDEIVDISAGSGTDLSSLMRSDLHGVYVWNRPEVRGEYEAKKYRVAKSTAWLKERGLPVQGWLQREDFFGVNDEGELTYGDAVIMVVTQQAFLDAMERARKRRKEAMSARGGELRTERKAPPAPYEDE